LAYHTLRLNIEQVQGSQELAPLQEDFLLDKIFHNTTQAFHQNLACRMQALDK